MNAPGDRFGAELDSPDRKGSVLPQTERALVGIATAGEDDAIPDS